MSDLDNMSRNNCDNHSILLEIYEHYRDEIKREDEITQHRLTISMAFQGLLFASTTLLISASAEGVSYELTVFREYMLVCIGLCGILVSIIASIGVIAARLSISKIKKSYASYIIVMKKYSKWESHLSHLPQIHGQGQSFILGNYYTVLVPISFTFIWIMYCAIYINLVFGKGIASALGIPFLIALCPLAPVAAPHIAYSLEKTFLKLRLLFVVGNSKASSKKESREETTTIDASTRSENQQDSGDCTERP